MVPAWQLDQVPLDSGQFTSIDSEVDDMRKKRDKQRVIVSLGAPPIGELDEDENNAFDPPNAKDFMRQFRIVAQLQILSRDNYLRTDLMTEMAKTVLGIVLGHIEFDSPFVHDGANGTITFLAQCVYQNVAELWCDPMQWQAVTAAMRIHGVRLAFARRIDPKVTTVEEALAQSPPT